MQSPSGRLRLRTLVSVGVLAVGVPALALAGVHRGEGAGLALTGTAGTAVSNTVGTVSGSTAVHAAGTALNGTALGATAGTAGTSSGTSAPCSTGGNLPADKMTVTDSVADKAGPNADVTILSACMRTSNPADLVFFLTAECSIVTTVTTVGNDDQSAFGQIRMWVEVDGKPVGIIAAHQGTSDDGRVVFCNRTHSQTTSMFVADPQATIKEGLATEEANAFNWVAMNVGSGIHSVTVHAELTQKTTADATANEVIGARTLVVDTTQTAQDQAPSP